MKTNERGSPAATPAIDRRKLLAMMSSGAALASGCAPLGGAGLPRPVDPSVDLADPAARVRAFVKASGRLTTGRAIWSTRAEVFAIIPPDQVVPVVRVKGCEQQWIKPLSDTEFVSFDNLVTYYCDFDSDQVIREYANPFTGTVNAVKPFVSRMPEGREISPRGVVYRVMREAYPDFYADLRFDVQIRQVGESVSFLGEFKWPAEFIRPPAGSKMTTFARAEDLNNPNLDSVPANFAGYVLMPFFPWMAMGDHPGHLLWHVQGYKISSLDDLADDYRAAASTDIGERFEQSPEFDTEPSAFARRLRAMGRLP